MPVVGLVMNSSDVCGARWNECAMSKNSSQGKDCWRREAKKPETIKRDKR